MNMGLCAMTRRLLLLILFQLLIVGVTYPLGKLLQDHIAISVNKSESLKGKLFLVLKGKPEALAKGDLVVFGIDGDKYYDNNNLLKRVVATSGDVIIRDGNNYYVNDELVATAKDYSKSGQKLNKYAIDEVWLQEGEYFVMGDHIDSYDSRYFGLVNQDQLEGKAYKISWWGEDE